MWEGRRASAAPHCRRDGFSSFFFLVLIGRPEGEGAPAQPATPEW